MRRDDIISLPATHATVKISQFSKIAAVY